MHWCFNILNNDSKKLINRSIIHNINAQKVTYLTQMCFCLNVLLRHKKTMKNGQFPTFTKNRNDLFFFNAIKNSKIQ